MSFAELAKDKQDGIKELRRTAEHDFAVALTEDEQKSSKLIQAALLEAGVTFEQYLECNPHQREKYAPETVVVEPEAPVAPENVVTSAQVTGTEPVEIVVKEETPLSTNQQWLVKMERANPVFEIAGYRFTDTHPYVLMPADAAEIVLREEGFRQAYPSEVQEYYG